MVRNENRPARSSNFSPETCCYQSRLSQTDCDAKSGHIKSHLPLMAQDVFQSYGQCKTEKREPTASISTSAAAEVNANERDVRPAVSLASLFMDKVAQSRRSLRVAPDSG